MFASFPKAASSPTATPLPPPPTPAPAPAPANDDQATVIYVEGHRQEIPAAPGNPTRFVTAIQLPHATETLDSVASELEKTPGVTVRRLGGLGSYSTVSIRGSTPAQVEIFWDGVPLNSAASGLTNLEDIPMDVIQQIDVYRGAAPAQFGAAGIGGVINLITRRPDPAQHGRPFGLVSVTGGSFDTWKFDAMTGGTADDGTGMLFFYHRLQSGGGFTYLNDNGTPLNPDDDHTDRRVNNALVSQDFFTRFDGALPRDWRWSLRVDAFDKRQGLPGLEAVQARHAHLRTGRGLVNLEATAPESTASDPDAAPAPVIGVNMLYEELQFTDPFAELALSPTDDLTETWSFGAHAHAGWELLDRRLFLSAFGEARHEESQAIAMRPQLTHEPVEKRDSLTGVLQAELWWLDGRLRLVPTLRGEVFFNHMAGDPRILTPGLRGATDATQQFLNPSLGFLYAPDDSFEVKANVGRFNRVPDFYELFGDQGTIVGAPGLAPERSDTFDLGFHWLPTLPDRLGRVELQYDFFYLYTDNLIALVRNSQNTSQAANVGAALNVGHEFDLRWDTARPVGGCRPALQFSYTHQDPRNDSDTAYLRGNLLPNQPQDSWFLRLENFFESTPPDAPLRLGGWFECAYTGETFRDPANLYPVAARTLLNAGLQYSTALHDQPGVTCTLEVKNLTDNRITDVADYPLPGRSWFGTVEVKF